MKFFCSILPCYKKIVVCFSFILLLAGLFEYAHTQERLEYKVKAAFLYNFAKFVEWPDLQENDPTLPFILGVLGGDPFGPELDIISSKNINGRHILIKRFQTIDDVTACNMLFIGLSRPAMLKEALKKIHGQPILSIGETEDFAQSGGIIGFVEKQNRIRFEINLKAAQSAGLNISSKLLKLAIIVEPKEDSDSL